MSGLIIHELQLPSDEKTMKLPNFMALSFTFTSLHTLLNKMSNSLGYIPNYPFFQPRTVEPHKKIKIKGQFGKVKNRF